MDGSVVLGFPAGLLGLVCRNVAESPAEAYTVPTGYSLGGPEERPAQSLLPAREG